MDEQQSFDVSIIVPTYNSENTIVRLLKSINLYCNNLKVELILVDDGSTDDTCYIERNFTFNKNIVSKIIKLSHSGVSTARNIGIENANGKYLVFFDSDDALSSEFQSLFSNSNNERFNAQVVSFSARVPQNHNNKVFKGKDIKYLALTMVYGKYKEFIPDEYEMSASNKLYLRSFILKYNIKFDPNLSFWEDLFFNMKILNKVETILVKRGDIFIYYQDNNNSVTHNATNSIVNDAKYVYKNSMFIFNDNLVFTKYEAAYFISRIVGGYLALNPNTKVYKNLIETIPLDNRSFKYADTIHHKFILWGLQHLGLFRTVSIYRILKSLKKKG